MTFFFVDHKPLQGETFPMKLVLIILAVILSLVGLAWLADKLLTDS